MRASKSCSRGARGASMATVPRTGSSPRRTASASGSFSPASRATVRQISALCRSHQHFLALLDGDRFEGRFRDGVHRVDVSDLMRRMTRSESVTPAVRRKRGTSRPAARHPARRWCDLVAEAHASRQTAARHPMPRTCGPMVAARARRAGLRRARQAPVRGPPSARPADRGGPLRRPPGSAGAALPGGRRGGGPPAPASADLGE